MSDWGKNTTRTIRQVDNLYETDAVILTPN